MKKHGPSEPLPGGDKPIIDLDPKAPPPLPWAVKKIKLPEFAAFDPQGWLQKALLYFEINEAWFQKAPHLKGGFRKLHISIPDPFSAIEHGWGGLALELLLRFSGMEVQNPYEQLATIKQMESIHDYIEDFEYLLSLVPKLSESQTLGYFMAGLRDDVKRWVHLHNPQSRIAALILAKNIEEMLRPAPGVFVLFLVQSGRNDERKACVIDVVSNLVLVTNVQGSLRILLLGDDEYEDASGEILRLEGPPIPDPEDEQPIGEMGACMALELSGVTDEPSGGKTLKLEGTISDIPIMVMVDLGATHNFISRRLITVLGLLSSSFSGIRIKLGDGHVVPVTNVCRQVHLQLGQCHF
ncbi:hypothetical protein LXL04_007804 [Taraxacum kok-saghyz]